MPDDRPKLRRLDMIPLSGPTGQQFLLRDPQRLATQEIVLPADIAYLLAQFDGTRTVREAQLSYVRRFGSLLTTDRINSLLDRLDQALLLDSQRFRQFAAQLEADFRARPTRPAAHAGRSYQEDAGAFTLSWQSRLAAVDPPGDFALDPRRPALIAPHYDMNAAADSYAAAYALLARTERPDVVVILGISHAGGAAFTLTRKPFETPFGALETDAQIIDQLARAAPSDPFAEEILHRDEHSIEFQAVLLHFLYREESDPPKIVAILCGSYHRRDEEFVDPAQPGPVSEFLELLQATLAADPRRVAVIASADLSHIGARFGLPPPLTQAHLDLARRHDTALLEKARTGDADGLYGLLAQAQDRHNVCGFPAIYALLRVRPVTEGRVLGYRQEVAAQTQSCVSFASVGLR